MVALPAAPLGSRCASAGGWSVGTRRPCGGNRDATPDALTLLLLRDPRAPWPTLPPGPRLGLPSRHQHRHYLRERDAVGETRLEVPDLEPGRQPVDGSVVEAHTARVGVGALDGEVEEFVTRHGPSRPSGAVAVARPHLVAGGPPHVGAAVEVAGRLEGDPHRATGLAHPQDLEALDVDVGVGQRRGDARELAWSIGYGHDGFVARR